MQKNRELKQGTFLERRMGNHLTVPISATIWSTSARQRRLTRKRCSHTIYGISLQGPFMPLRKIWHTLRTYWGIVAAYMQTLWCCHGYYGAYIRWRCHGGKSRNLCRVRLCNSWSFGGHNAEGWIRFWHWNKRQQSDGTIPTTETKCQQNPTDRRWKEYPRLGDSHAHIRRWSCPAFRQDAQIRVICFRHCCKRTKKKWMNLSKVRLKV